MRFPSRLAALLPATLPMCLALLLPAAAFAADGAADPVPAPKSAPAGKPDVQQKKVWTNDDVVRLNPAFDANAPRGSAVASALPVSAAPSASPAAIRIAPAAPLDPQKDPAWYAQQLVSLEAQQDAVAGREDELRQFRASDATISTSGLVLNAPCEGITTDNLIAQLEARRQEIAAQIDELGDTARHNGIAPGILADPSRYALVASEPTARQQVADALQQAQEASEEIAQIQATVTDMQEQLAAQNMTLQPPTPGNGGNMTTDLLDRLDNRADALRGAVAQADDVARTLGVPPGDLR